MSLKSNQLMPGQSSFQDTYAWILYQLGNYEEALEWINKALNSTSGAGGVLLEHKGDILYQLGNEEEAVEFWKKANEAGGASEFLPKKIADKKLYE
jgi:tetratricopeptide (TPR) repeat protein